MSADAKKVSPSPEEVTAKYILAPDRLGHVRDDQATQVAKWGLALKSEAERLSREAEMWKGIAEARQMRLIEADNRTGGYALKLGEVERALAALVACPYGIDEATVPKAGIDAAPEQVVGTMSVSLLKLRAARMLLGLESDGRGRWETPAPNSPEIPDGSPSDSDFVSVRNTLAGSPGAADYNDAFNALLRLSLKAGKWDAAVARSTLTGRLRHLLLRNGIDRMNIGDMVRWVLHGDDAKETP